MKTIEERSEIWSDNREAYCLSAPMLMKESYYQGATDQKKIDVDAACEWLTQRLQFGCHPCDGYSLVNEFCKEMENCAFTCLRLDKESIDEKILDELTLEYVNKQWCTKYKSLSEITDDLDECAVEDFKAGYRKAKELWHTKI